MRKLHVLATTLIGAALLTACMQDNAAGTVTIHGDDASTAHRGPAEAGDASVHAPSATDNSRTGDGAETEEEVHIGTEEDAVVTRLVRRLNQSRPAAGGPSELHLPYEDGVHTGISQGTHCGSHAASGLTGSIDFSIRGAGYESSHGIYAAAAAPGEVIHVVDHIAGFVARSYGNHVLLRHADGTVTMYAHLVQYTVQAQVGDSVCQGQRLGLVGTTGQSSGDHLHFEHRDVNGRRMVPSFVESDGPLPSGCVPCVTYTHESGCWESENVFFCADPPPEPPTLLAPAADARFEEGDRIRLRWARSEGKHTLKVRRNPPNGPVILEQEVDATELSLDGLTVANYRWTVYVEHAGCRDHECAAMARTFTVAAAPIQRPPANDDPDDLCANIQCGAHGECDENSGRCRCDDGFTGTRCDRCQTGHRAYPECYQVESCPEQCSTNGVCDDRSGTCECDRGFTGPSCDGCDDGYGNYPTCYQTQACPNQCSGHGSCNDRTGACACRPGFTGAGCNRCAPGFENYPRCTRQAAPAPVEPEPQAQANCRVQRVYPGRSGSYTGGTCDVGEHAIYMARASDPSGNRVDITVTKCPGGGAPSADVPYWVVTGEENPTDDRLCIGNARTACGDRSCCRANGTWRAGQRYLTARNVRVFPDDTFVGPEHEGEEKLIYVQTGGGDSPNAYWWHQGRSLRFRVVCD